MPANDYIKDDNLDYESEQAVQFRASLLHLLPFLQEVKMKRIPCPTSLAFKELNRVWHQVVILKRDWNLVAHGR